MNENKPIHNTAGEKEDLGEALETRQENAFDESCREGFSCPAGKFMGREKKQQLRNGSRKVEMA